MGGDLTAGEPGVGCYHAVVAADVDDGERDDNLDESQSIYSDVVATMWDRMG